MIVPKQHWLLLNYLSSIVIDHCSKTWICFAEEIICTRLATLTFYLCVLQNQFKGILSTSCVIFSYPKLLSISVLTFIKCDEKYFGRTDGQRLNNIPPSPSGSGGIIRSKIGSKCIDLILIRLAKCWNNFISSKYCIWLFCENGKYMIILWKCQVGIYFFSSPAKFLFFKIQNQNNFLGKKT
jgi:hypothetical protein